ncbi:hypothetical protein lerEdw1_013082 [Lerista edwardsae]|nr:hypothetical protein lerEdw1_013082 [Lerista edwardsae]
MPTDCGGRCDTIKVGDMMASGEQRRWRRKKSQRGKSMAVDSCCLVNLEKEPADIERLAHKYMQKCTVESSSESESDANIEALSSSMASEGFTEQTSHTKLQFLDPYDGDYEDLSGTSDCSLDSLADMSQILQGCPIFEALTAGGCFLPEGQEPFLASADRAVSATITQEGELDQHEPREVVQLQMEPFWLSGSNSSKHSECSKRSAAALQSTLMECDNGVCEGANAHKKQGRPVLENAGEKLRKKLRVT